MRRSASHLFVILGILLSLYATGNVGQALGLARARSFSESWGLYILGTLTLVVVGVLLAAPHWWHELQLGRGLSMNLGVLAIYAIPGLVLVVAFSLSYIGTVVGSWANTGVLSRGGGDVFGGVLIGFGIGQSLFGRTKVEGVGAYGAPRGGITKQHNSSQ